jgi:hypothetical protein
MEKPPFNQGFSSGLDEPQRETIAIDPLLCNFQFGGDSDAQWDDMTFVDIQPENPQMTSIPLSMDGMPIGPWTN